MAVFAFFVSEAGPRATAFCGLPERVELRSFDNDNAIEDSEPET
jgi:hypothetical protein